MSRLTQRQLRPAAVKTRIIGDFISVTKTLEATATLSNGDDALFTALIENLKDARMIGETEFSLWKTSVTDANLMPNGSSVDASKWQIVGPWNEWSDAARTNGVVENAIKDDHIASRIYVRNISAGASTVVLVKARIRYITNHDNVASSLS